MQRIVIKFIGLIFLFCCQLLTGCNRSGSYIYNDTGKRLLIESPATENCNPSNDYLENGQVVYDRCWVSETILIKLTDHNGNFCNVNIDDFKRNIIVTPIKNIWGGKVEEMYLSKLNCPTLGLPKKGIQIPHK